MKLSQLLNSLVPWQKMTDPLITHITANSREVKSGSLFLAMPGTSHDGRNFITAAVAQNAAAILYAIQSNAEDAEKSEWQQHLPSSTNIPIIPCLGLEHMQGLIAARFYGYPSAKMNVIGVTGTNGKTSCTHFIAEAFAEAQQSCAIAGTVGNGFLPNLQKSAFTTLSAIDLQAELARFFEAGAQWAAMEVSSHSLVQHRVAGVQFNIAVFTQLSRDHLDYHGTMENYAAAKSQLFAFKDLSMAVINYDDLLGQKLIAQYKNKLNIVAYSALGKAHDEVPSVIAENITMMPSGFQLKVITPWGEGELLVPLLGKFNVSNVLAVLSVLGLSQIPFTTILAALSKLKPVVGRMQQFGGETQPLVIIDYAHTPDALEKVLLSLRDHRPRTLWCVFGCGGDRDRGKRPLMAKVAERYSDQVIVTQDNPRYEKPEKIMDEICQGFTNPHAVVIQPDRALAIAYAISHAECQDIVLIAGKGHEVVQIIGDQSLPFSDQEETIRCLKRR